MTAVVDGEMELTLELLSERWSEGEGERERRKGIGLSTDADGRNRGREGVSHQRLDVSMAIRCVWY